MPGVCIVSIWLDFIRPAWPDVFTIAARFAGSWQGETYFGYCLDCVQYLQGVVVQVLLVTMVLAVDISAACDRFRDRETGQLLLKSRLVVCFLLTT